MGSHAARALARGSRKSRPEIAEFFAGTISEPEAVFFAQEGSTVVAVMELSIRRDLNGIGDAVGYVEGLYVMPAFRGRGIARKLLVEAKEWARRNGCDSFASDRADRIIVDPGF